MWTIYSCKEEEFVGIQNNEIPFNIVENALIKEIKP